MNSVHSFRRFFWIALAITVLRIVYLFFNHRDLDIEEGQYWAWSRHLALGYHSKPPMISWAIYFTTRLFGNSEWAIRLFSPLTYLGTALFLYGASKDLYHRTIGFWAGIVVLLIPGVTYSASIISTDPFLVLFWSMALYAFINGCKTTQLRWWALCGLAIGLGLLSKYTMLMFFLCSGLYFICAAEIPAPLKKPGPYIAVLIAAVVFAPNVIWNTRHANAALHHVVTHNIAIQGDHVHWLKLESFLISQIGILGPVLIIFLIMALWSSRKMTQHRESTRLLICFTLPPLIIICAEALLSRAYANWAVVAYPSGIILTIAYMWEQHFRRWIKFTVILHILVALLLYGWELAVAYGFYHWPLPNHPNWQDFGAVLNRDHQRHPETFYLVSNRQLWSKSLYYGKVPENNLYVWNPKQKVDWLDSPGHFKLPAGQDFMYITNNPNLATGLKRSFKNYRLLDSMAVNQRLRGRRMTVYVYWLQDSNSR